MKKSLLFALLFVCGTFYAQLEDISFTITPTAEYVWWDSKAGLADDFLYGGKVGFGFGEHLELSAIFQTANNLKTDFSSFGISNFSSDTFEAQDVELIRYGGEFKINFSNRTLGPYITLGTGIQKLKTDANRLEQIYLGLGLGLRYAISNRVNLLLETRAVGFDINAASHLLTQDNLDEYDDNTTDFSSNSTLNIGASAALQFYLGGRKPGELSRLDKAYLKQYRGSFQGWSWVAEPSLAYMDFDSDSNFRDTWMAGAYFGVDFTDFVGLRAFYFHALEDEKISTDLDRINKYGLEFRAKLNDGRGVTPYLVLGGGYLNAQSGYEGRSPALENEGSSFVNTGLGLDMPLGRNVLITAGAKALVTSAKEVLNPTGPEVIQTHFFYNAGIKIQVGKKPVRPEDILKEEAKAFETLEAKAFTGEAKNHKRLVSLIIDYENDIRIIDEEITKATKENNSQRAIELLEDKRVLSQELRKVRALERKYKQKGIQGDGEYLKMTPQEFETLIDRILQGIDEKYNTGSNTFPKTDIKSVENQSLTNEVLELRQEIMRLSDMSEQQAAISQERISESLKNENKRVEEFNALFKENEKRQKQLDKLIESLESRLEKLNERKTEQQKQTDGKKEEKE